MKKILVSIVLITPLALQANDMPIREKQNNDIAVQQENKSTNETNKKYNSMKLPNFVGTVPDYFDIELGEIIRFPESTFVGTTILLVGKPGTGKTLLVNEIIRESGLEVIRIPMKKIYDKPVPEGYRNHAYYADDVIQNALAKARGMNSSVIVFVDDVDYGYSYDKLADTIDLTGEILPNIQDKYRHIKFIATATDIEIFPKDIPYRRIDVFPLSLPDYQSRKAILEFHLKKHRTEETINLSIFARASHGFSGGDLVQVIDDAANLAKKHSNSSQITQTDLWTAFKPIRYNVALHQWEGGKQSTQNFLIEYGPTILAVVAAIIVSLLLKKKNKK